MPQFKILGSGCNNCKVTAKLIYELASSMNIEVDVIKVEDMATILKYGIMSTPGVVIDEKVVHSGGVPNKSQVRLWLESL